MILIDSPLFECCAVETILSVTSQLDHFLWPYLEAFNFVSNAEVVWLLSMRLPPIYHLSPVDAYGPSSRFYAKRRQQSFSPSRCSLMEQAILAARLRCLLSQISSYRYQSVAGFLCCSRVPQYLEWLEEASCDQS